MLLACTHREQYALLVGSGEGEAHPPESKTAAIGDQLGAQLSDFTMPVTQLSIGPK